MNMNSKQHAAFVDGYQAAMHDIAFQLLEDGEAGVRQWLKDNTLPVKPKPLKWHGGNGYWTGKRSDGMGPLHVARRVVSGPDFPTVVDWVWEVDGEFRNAYKALADVRYYAERFSRSIQLGVAPSDPRTDPTTNPL